MQTSTAEAVPPPYEGTAVISDGIHKSVRVQIAGRVQGVGYRDWVQRTARSMSVCGWVRNRRDGSVEAVFCGRDVDVDAMLAKCWQGPPAAKVTGLVADAEAEQDRCLGFDIRPTV